MPGKKATIQHLHSTSDIQAWVVAQNKIDYVPKVSVIVPVYNVAQYLRECLDSVINQTLTDIEIICINDGSTDTSLDILKQYTANDKRITVVSRGNMGVSVSRNNGLTIARGKYILFVDSDDWLDTMCCEKLYSKISETGSDICLYSACKYDNNTSEYSNGRYFTTAHYGDEHPDICDYHDIKSKVFSRFYPWSKMYRRDFLINNNIRFEQGVYFEDVAHHIDSMLSAKKISFVDDVLYFYRAGRNGSIMSSTKDKNAMKDVFDFLNKSRLLLQDKGFYPLFKNEYIKFVDEQIAFHSMRYAKSRGGGKS